jgi:hypothetical protein
MVVSGVVVAISLPETSLSTHLSFAISGSILGNSSLSGVGLIRIVHQLGAFDFGSFDEQMDLR